MPTLLGTHDWKTKGATTDSRIRNYIFVTPSTHDLGITSYSRIYVNVLEVSFWTPEIPLNLNPNCSIFIDSQTAAAWSSNVATNLLEQKSLYWKNPKNRDTIVVRNWSILFNMWLFVQDLSFVFRNSLVIGSIKWVGAIKVWSLSELGIFRVWFRKIWTWVRRAWGLVPFW